MKLQALISVLACLAVVCACENTQRVDQIRFSEIAEDTGLIFDHFNAAGGEYLIPEIMGAGTALVDFDKDGDLDVFFVQGMQLDPDLSADNDAQRGHRLFRNTLMETGVLEFEDISAVLGSSVESYGMGVAVADYDGDGWQDIYITAYGQNTLLHNENGKSFRDVTAEAGVGDVSWSSSASFLDIDNDADLDLYVTNYLDFSIENNRVCKDAIIARGYCHPLVYPPAVDRLYRNDGNGSFTDISAAAGIVDLAAPGLGVAAADVNADGWSDLYVVNDREANLLWMNTGNGSFVEQGLPAGVAYNMDGRSEAGMGVTAGDFESDGDVDFFVTHYDPETNTLYLNNGEGFFQDATDSFGLGHVSLGYTGWGTAWVDYDNNGSLDLFVANGAVTVQADQLDEVFPYRQANQLFMHETGNGFVEIKDFATHGHDREVSRGAAFGDLDNDGDVDIVVTNNSGRARLLRNDQSSGYHWLQIMLIDPVSDGIASGSSIGARIEVHAAGMPTQTRFVRTDGSYLSASDPRAHFGLGSISSVTKVVVAWPDGEQQQIDNPAIDQLLVVRR